jgi:hypothetical protein
MGDLSGGLGIGRGGRLAAGVSAFTGTLATMIVQLPPYDPESTGLVERRNGFFENSFMPGRAFASPADFNAQFGDWLVRANARGVRTIKARPVDHDRSRTLALPPVPPHLGWRERVRLGRDYHVRLDTGDYSADPTAIGRMVDVSADLDRVRVSLQGRAVGDHVRAWARGATIADPDPDHVATARSLRQRAMNVVVARCPITSRVPAGMPVRLKSVIVFTCVNRAALIRIRVPFTAGEAT